MNVVHTSTSMYGTHSTLFSKVGVLRMVIYIVNTDVSTNLTVTSASVIVITLCLLMDGVYHNCLVLAGIVGFNPFWSMYICLM
jgi:hypothetical protein